MAKNGRKPKMTLDKLATMTQSEFLAMGKKVEDIRENMATKDDLEGIKDDLKHFATKEDLKHFSTKEDIRGIKEEIVDEVRKENVKVIQSNDKVVTKLDLLLVEEVARTEQYKRRDKDIALIKQKE